jgi:hypothetical protein
VARHSIIAPSFAAPFGQKFAAPPGCEVLGGAGVTLKRRVGLPVEGRWVNAWRCGSFLVDRRFLCGCGFEVTRVNCAGALGEVLGLCGANVSGADLFRARIRRVRRVQTPLGFKVVQVTNAYQVTRAGAGLRALGCNFLRKIYRVLAVQFLWEGSLLAAREPAPIGRSYRALFFGQ